MRNQPTSGTGIQTPQDDNAKPLDFVAEPRNRRERRARAAQERAVKRALARGQTPKVFIPVE